MNAEDQRTIIDALLAHLDARTTASADAVRAHDVASYLSPELLARECETFFVEHPVVAALSADIPRANDFVAQELLGIPVLLVRGGDGVARAFINVCRHRGARVESECRGTKRAFVCPFHAWRYDANGRLCGVPRSGSFGGVAHAAEGLTALPTVERYGIVWIRLRPGPAFDIAPFLGSLGPELESWDLRAKHFVGAKTIASRTNWKLAIDTFGETYHFDVLHRDTVAPLLFANTQLYDTYRRNHRMIFAARSLASLRQLPRSAWTLRPHAVLAYYLFPNTQLLLQFNGIALFRVFPEGNAVDRTVTHMSFYSDAAAASEAERAQHQSAFEGTAYVIEKEDYAVAEGIQAGFASSAQRTVLFGRNEPGLQHYHATYRAALGIDPLATATADVTGDGKS